MSEWKQKRFWTEVAVTEAPGGFDIRLDGRAVRTPGKAPLVLPTEALAQAIAAEWQAQDGAVDPRTMPHTRMANSAIDKVQAQKPEVAALLADYGGSDLLCYRATGPAALIARQAEGWDPLLDWAAATLGVRLRAVSGVMHVQQDPDALALLQGELARLDVFCLAAMHDLVSLSGSLVIGLAAARHQAPPEALWRLSRIDEDWQIAQWGHDDEAAQAAETKRRAFLEAATFYDLAQKLPLPPN